VTASGILAETRCLSQRATVSAAGEAGGVGLHAFSARLRAAMSAVRTTWSLSQAPPAWGISRLNRKGGFRIRAATDDPVARLTAPIKRGGDLDPLLDALRDLGPQRANLHRKIAAFDTAPRSVKLAAAAAGRWRFRPRIAANPERGSRGCCAARLSRILSVASPPFKTA